MLWAIYGVDRTGTADLATCTCGLAANSSIDLRQRPWRSKQGLRLRPYPRGHVPTFGEAAGARRDMGIQ